MSIIISTLWRAGAATLLAAALPALASAQDRADGIKELAEAGVLVQKLEQHLNERDFHAAATGVRALMFLEKFGEEVRFAYDALEA